MMNEPRRIDRVILWQNNVVMVFDQYGQQMPEYQGAYEDVKDKINAVYVGVWEHRTWPLSGPGDRVGF